MKKKNTITFFWFFIMFASMALIGFGVTPAMANSGVDEGVAIESTGDVFDDFEGEDLALEEGDGSFGSGSQATWIPAADFVTADSLVSYSRGPFGVGAKCRTGGSSYWFDAGIRLPSGARLSIARIFYYDTHSSQRVWFWIFRNTQTESSAAYSYAQIFGPLQSPVGSAGYGNAGGNVNLTVANRYNTYTARFRSEGSNTCFFGVRLFWYRQQAPAGGVIFNDVGSSHQFYQAINNMYRSGITTGCPYPNYCPNNFVTRGQMAAFLARALGLHWAYSSGY